MQLRFVPFIFRTKKKLPKTWLSPVRVQRELLGGAKMSQVLPVKYNYMQVHFVHFDGIVKFSQQGGRWTWTHLCTRSVRPLSTVTF
jgi:hypothetical protein